MARPTLPLRGIAVFEAVSRLGSFRAAAAELNLTPSAVSHQIRLLESTLGVRLFQRSGRGVSLSTDGSEYARGIGPGFRRLRRATEDMSRRVQTGVPALVRIQTPPSFASRWLLPRLPRLLVEHPGIDVRVTAEADVESGFDAADLTIIYGNAGRSHSVASAFLRESVQPLCAPALLTSRPTWLPRDLPAQTLIRTRMNAFSWEDWLHAQGLEVDGPLARSVQLDPSHVAIEAAVNGLGVVLESDVLTQGEVDTGRLVAPFSNASLTAASYSLVRSSDSSASPAVDATQKWLFEQAMLSGAVHR